MSSSRANRCQASAGLRDHAESHQSGDYQPGDRIPSEANLIQEFGVSRPTVARALQDLQRRGLVNRRRGAGTYVSRANVSSKQFGLLIPGLGDTEVFEPICAEMARVAQRDGHSLLWGAAHMAPTTTRMCQRRQRRDRLGFVPAVYSRSSRRRFLRPAGIDSRQGLHQSSNRRRARRCQAPARAARSRLRQISGSKQPRFGRHQQSPRGPHDHRPHV